MTNQSKTQHVSTTPAGGGDITPAPDDRSTSLAKNLGEATGVVEPPKPEASPAAAGSDEITIEELFQFDIPGLDEEPGLTAVMIDIESLDIQPTAAIASIGAVWFDPHGTRIGDTFHLHVDLEDCQRHGLTIGADTVLWWLKQSGDAQAALGNGQLDAAPLATALEALHAFLAADEDGPDEVWCNGASFDFPILANAYARIGWKTPWPFWRERDLRTLKGLYQAQRIERHAMAHHALNDAIHQARLVQHLMRNIDA
jgi:hypothetical protein